VKGRVVFTILAGVALMAAGLFVLFLFIIPSFRPAGLDGVYVKSKYMTYYDVEHILEQRNFVIEGDSTEVIIRIRKVGYEDESRIQVFENANGVSFNSVNRTHVDFLEYIDEDNVAHCKIIIQEPKGAVSRRAKVYINLKRDHKIHATEEEPYNFILNTGRGTVRFENDPSAEYMHIDTLQVNGTGDVILPAPIAVTPQNQNPFELRVTNLRINSPNASVNCRSKIYGLTSITGNSRSIVLGDIENLNVEGTSNVITVENIGTKELGGNVDFKSNGSLTINGQAKGRVYVRGDNVRLQARRIHSLDFETIGGQASASRVDDFSFVRMQEGTLTLGAKGNGLGVFGNVDIDKLKGGASVIFANDETATGNCKIRAGYNPISVHGVRGKVDIYISSMGTADVYVGFSLVHAESRIIIEGSRELNYSGGNVTVALLNNARADLGVTLHLRGTWQAIDQVTAGRPKDDELLNCHNTMHSVLDDWQSDSSCVLNQIRDGGELLYVKTQGSFLIRAGAY